MITTFKIILPTPVNTSGDDDIGAGAFRFEGNPDCQSQ